MIDKITRYRLLQLSYLLLATLGACLVLRRFFSLETLVANELWLREALAARPLRGLAIAMAVFTVLSMIPGLAGKSVVCGWFLGFLKGLLVVNIGLTIAALLGFLISRYLLRDIVWDKLDWFMRRLRDNDGMFLLTLRLLHAPFSVTNYAVGATDVGVRRFWWTTQLGLLPGNIAFVFAGASLPSLRQLQVEGIWSIVNVPLLVGLTAVGFAPVMIRWAVHRNLRRSRHESCGS